MTVQVSSVAGTVIQVFQPQSVRLNAEMESTSLAMKAVMMETSLTGMAAAQHVQMNLIGLVH